MIGRSALTTQQILRILQKTPENHIYRRPAKGGGQWDYVTGVYIKKCLNYTFGWMWSSSVLSIEEKYGQVCATVRLTIQDASGNELLHKDDIGKKDIVMRKETGKPLDYGNDMKAAVTDGLKRCAAQFGFASDVYGKNEFQEIKAGEVEMISDAELPVSAFDKDPASPAQKQTVKKMGGTVTKKMTSGEAKQEIARLLQKI